MPGERCFLDIDVGDEQAYDAEVEKYGNAVAFLDQCGAQYGLPGARPEDLDAEGQEMIREAFESVGDWSARGGIRFDQPPDLSVGRLIIELEGSTPKTAENFRCLCTGERGLGKASKKPLHFKGCTFYRVIEGFMAQTGDVVKGDGSAGDSIYGGKFAEEKPGLKLKHAVRGVVGMANSGRNSNTSQFYITFGKAPHLDGKHVVFGKVVAGLDVLDRIEAEAASASGTPRAVVTIADCGVCDGAPDNE